ncbi:chorismate-binding protein [Candidatus Vidania fulgoroideorum]
MASIKNLGNFFLIKKKYKNDPINYFFLLKKIFKYNLYYSFYSDCKTRFIYFGFNKINNNIFYDINSIKFKKNDFLQIFFTIIGYDYFHNKSTRNNFYSIFPEILFYFDTYQNKLFIIFYEKKTIKNFIKMNKIKNFLNNKYKSKNFFFRYSNEISFFKKDYIYTFLKIKNSIVNGNIMQIQLSKNILMKSNINVLLLLKMLSIKNNNKYINFFSSPKNNVICLSPEKLFLKKNNNINVYPIAGTISRGNNIFLDLLFEFKLINDIKERSEHIMLIDLSRNDLNKISLIGKTNIIKKFIIKKFFYLQHIVSNIFTQTKIKKKIYYIFKSIHPSGTLTGTPKIESIKKILKLEKYNRKFYGGALGFINKKTADFNIIIRSCLFKNNYIFLRAASGIVLNSKLKLEWKEINNKLKIFYYKK